MQRAKLGDNLGQSNYKRKSVACNTNTPSGAFLRKASVTYKKYCRTNARPYQRKREKNAFLAFVV